MRQGAQRPTQSLVLPYSETKGMEAVDLYNQSGRTAIEWQELLLCDIMAVDEDGLWIHQKFGYSVPRRNGKNEVVVMRELYGLENGLKGCHTAHRTTTSHSAWERLVKVLSDMGYTELGRKTKGEKPPEKSYRTTKAYGLESIEIPGKGSVVFRTRTANGGLGEGFDYLVIDEAQEYTDDQEAALIYTVSDSPNPQTIFCGTPPTTTSAGTVFTKLRRDVLAGDTCDTGWAEWSVESKPKDISDVELWYQTNPSMGFHLNERKIRSEIRSGDTLDFEIQRLGYWYQYSLKSAISEAEWLALKAESMPEIKGKLFAGIKYGRDGTNVSLSIAVKTKDNRIFTEAIDCRPIRAGNQWLLAFLGKADLAAVVIDGQNGQELLKKEMQEAGIKKKPILPTVREVIAANAMFEQAVFGKTLCHMGQPSLTNVVSNCEKRAIGSSGGFGYRSIKDTADITLLDSAALALWACSEYKDKAPQKITY